ncbi:MAG: transcription factor FapR [Eubacteriales bacterium]|nr:transcription factor FapR [Eubacteriales bacterium]
MSKTSLVKKERQDSLRDKIKTNPFLTDEDIAAQLTVSVPTVRLYRLELGIPELRERIKNVAEDNYNKVRSLDSSEIVGELMDIQLGSQGVSVLETTKSMTFEKSKIVRGHFIYSLAESLAIAVIDANVALVGVANIKYKIPVYAGSRLYAKAQVKSNKGNSFIVWVNIMERQTEVFRGKFILVALEKSEQSQ